VICELCNKKNATVHLTEVQNNTKTELHLCDTCARQKGLVQKFNMTLNDLLNKLVQPKETPETKKYEGLVCDRCGMTYAEFRQRGRFGCPHDAVAFEKGLEPLLEKIHGATRHTGRVPGTSSESVKLQEQLMRLRRDLEEMKKQENYERCAELRDQISTLEEKLKA
jgi:protein arginine kinase activator